MPNANLDTIDRINRTLLILKATRMAATGDATPSDYGDPIVTMLDVIQDELSACVQALANPGNNRAA
jgi:hypothetical protein